MKAADLSLVDARRALQDGALSCVEYAQALLTRAAAGESLNAWVERDTEALLRDSLRADSAGIARDPARLLAGIPIALKDNIDTAALATSAGTRALLGRRPAANAPAAQSLFDAGAILAGKTNMHELAFGITSNNAVTGAVHNPWRASHIAGGSSGGSAAAVAARMVPAALGTDTGGSVRLPAALCGVVGFRPSTGRYAGAGVVPISHTRDTIGPIARSVEDIALLDRVLSGAGSASEGSGAAIAPVAFGAHERRDLRGLRIGVPRRQFHEGAEPGVTDAIERALNQLASAGVELVETELIDLEALNAAVGFPVVLYEMVGDLAAYLAASGYGLTLAQVAERIGSPDVAGIVASQLGADAMPRAAYDAALHARPRLQAAYAECFVRDRLDALAFPTAILSARPIGDDETVELLGARVPTFPTYIRNTDPGSNAGIPGISLPVGLTPDGLPVGLELDGPLASDRHLLGVAAAIFAALPPMTAPPGFPS